MSAWNCPKASPAYHHLLQLDTCKTEVKAPTIFLGSEIFIPALKLGYQSYKLE
jgi:hypothetical protein